MLSICIPTYNSDITLLYKSLFDQLKELKSSIEIIIIDDASSDSFKNTNRNNCTNATYIELSKNIGRAKIRNLFLEHAKYNNLLFLDCDSKIINKDYLANYIEAISNSNNHVFFGGSIYPTNKPAKHNLLRWEYGSKKESKTYDQRILIGNQSFMTNNFLISKTIFEKIKFDEDLAKYGYEDTLFGFNLTSNGIAINQLDNPVLNNEYDTNTEYLEKISESIDNLEAILNKIENKKEFINSVKILRTYQSLKERKVIGIFNFFFKIKKPILKKMLISGNYISITLFNIYKLGLLSNKLSKIS